MKKNILRNAIISMSLFIMPFTSFASEEFEENTQNKTHKFEDTFLDNTFELSDIKEDHLISIKDTDLKNPTNKSLLKTFLKKRNNKVQILLSEGGFVDKKGVLNMSKTDIGSIRHISLIDEKGIAISIGDNFLTGSRSLEIVDTRGLTSVTSIGNKFLSRCYSLKRFDTQGLKSLISIVNSFLLECGYFEKVIVTKRKSFFWKKEFSGRDCIVKNINYIIKDYQPNIKKDQEERTSYVQDNLNDNSTDFSIQLKGIKLDVLKSLF